MKINRTISLQDCDMRGVMAIVDHLYAKTDGDTELRAKIMNDIEVELTLLAQKAFAAGIEEVK